MGFENVRFAKRFFKETFCALHKTAFASFEILAVAKMKKYLCVPQGHFLWARLLFKNPPCGHH